MRRITGELAGIAEHAMRQATAVIRNATRALRTADGHRRGRLRRAINDLDTFVGRTERVVAQARSRLAGVMPESSSRLVSLHDVDARPIRKGLLGKPVEFGYKAQIVDNADGVILDHNVEVGNPADAPQLAPGSNGSPPAPDLLNARSPPTAATASRPSNATCTSPEYVAWRSHERVNPAPRAESSNTGEPSATRSNGGPDPKDESTTSNDYGWNRTELTGIHGARTWCGHGVFAHNPVKIGALAA